ncbi:hypothetical protein DZK27_11575 [Rhodobacteraceae bacterium 63075]|nr:hypothetical protein DZK27_11575 [Rhodobacteraceae bacterium 63075]
MNQMTAEQGRAKIGETVAALVRELETLRQDLAAYRQRLRARDTVTTHIEAARLEQVSEWIGIAIEVETRLGRQQSNERGGGAAGAKLDLGAARASIGGKLDRLRAAQRADGVPRQPDG